MTSPTLADLKQYAPRINARVVEVIDDFARTLTSEELSPQNEWALRVVRDYCLREGKHIRGALAALTYDHLMTQAPSERAIQLAASVELMHNYLLIIDDVMDQSPLRRGRKTIHELYREEYPDATIVESDMMGINTGLLVQHLAGFALAGLDNTGELERAMHRNIALTGMGQIDDMYQKVVRGATSDEVLTKYAKKSSFYTFVNPIECAYVLAGRNDDTARRDCREYGVPAGIAFQLHDDYLGIFGDSTASGKANLDDIHEGKTTLLVVEALRLAGAQERTEILEIIGNHQAGEAELLKIRAIMQSSGALEVTQSKTAEMVVAAIEAARQAESWNVKYADFLVELTEYGVKRTV